ncbi:Uncharacterised protein [Mycobacteroides abscessus subsp. abscessus]|nr:Uncharacterised protein [Mycobacteroides abscessus subsp. abscessus]
MVVLILGSALVAISLMTPVARSATRAVLPSLPMMRPLVASRHPCITPSAGHCLGNSLPGNGGGGVVVVCATPRRGTSVNG